VDLAINPTPWARLPRIGDPGNDRTHQGTGTFISRKEVQGNEVERRRRLTQLTRDFVARAARDGFTVDDLLESRRNFPNKEMTMNPKVNLEISNVGVAACVVSVTLDSCHSPAEAHWPLPVMCLVAVYLLFALQVALNGKRARTAAGPLPGAARAGIVSHLPGG